MDACELLTKHLKENGDNLVENWIDWLKERVQTTTVASLPERALRNHIPPILQNLAKYISHPVEMTRQEMLGHLKIHGQIRRDQGYSLQEVLAEFDGLAEIVTVSANQILESHSQDSKLDGLLDASTRLAKGLRIISFVAMGTYTHTDKDRFQSTSADLEEMIRAIGHELRNPLNAMSLNLGMLSDELKNGGNEEQVYTVDTVLGSVRKATELVDTIRTIALAEGARAGNQLSTLVEVVEKIKHEFSDNCLNENIEFKIQENLPNVSIEAVPLFIVLSNLVTNSIKYSDSNKDDKWVSLDAEIIEEEHDSGFCKIIISDNGIGIPEEFIARVCQKGFRAHPEIGYGTGYGLFFSDHALSTRGGDLKIESEENVGTTVEIKIRCLLPDSNTLAQDQLSIEYLMSEVMLDSKVRDES